jgi:CHAT domain-containing protein
VAEAPQNNRQIVHDEEKLPAAGPLFKLDPGRPYAHPYYWAPFILIGNWK